jgi:hypothetical protein
MSFPPNVKWGDYTHFAGGSARWCPTSFECGERRKPYLCILLVKNLQGSDHCEREYPRLPKKFGEFLF